MNAPCYTNTGALAGMIGHWQILIIVLAVLLLFGGRKLPELAKGLGRGLRLFKAELHGLEKDINEAPEEPQHAKKLTKAEDQDA